MSPNAKTIVMFVLLVLCIGGTGAGIAESVEYHRSTDELRAMADAEHNPMITLGVADAESDRALVEAVRELTAAFRDQQSAPAAPVLADVSAERLAAEVPGVGPVTAAAILARFRVVEKPPEISPE